MRLRPTVVMFDAIGTLFSLAATKKTIRSVGLPEHLAALWFASSVRDGIALDAAGSYEPFLEVARGRLEVLLADQQPTLKQTQKDQILESMSRLDAFEDVAPAFARLEAEGIAIGVLTHGTRDATAALIKRAKLEHLIEHIVSADDIGHWKPRREVYLHGVRSVGGDAVRVALVAAHAWDVHGARQAGLTTGWVKRTETRFHPRMARADVEGDSLVEVAGKLASLGLQSAASAPI